MPASVAPISCSSSCAGTTTAPRLLSSIAPAREARRDTVPHQRDDRAEHEPDQGGHDDGIAAAARRDARSMRTREDGRLLDLDRLDEQLAGAQLVLLVVRQSLQ